LTYIQNSKGGGLSGPSEEYEVLRRRIFSNTKELWYFINSQLQSLNKEVDGAGAHHIAKIKKTIGEHYRSLLKDITNLGEADGQSIWRQQESEYLSNLVQKRLKHLQNPPDCTKARKLVCDLNKVCYKYNIFLLISNNINNNFYRVVDMVVNCIMLFIVLLLHMQLKEH